MHHELTDRVIKEMNDSVLKLSEQLSKDGNLYLSVSNSSLYYFDSKEVLPQENKEYLLNI